MQKLNYTRLMLNVNISFLAAAGEPETIPTGAASTDEKSSESDQDSLAPVTLII